MSVYIDLWHRWRHRNAGQHSSLGDMDRGGWSTPAVWQLTLTGPCGTVVYTCPALNWVCCGGGASSPVWTCTSSTCVGGPTAAPGINVGGLAPNGNCGSCSGLTLTATIVGGSSCSHDSAGPGVTPNQYTFGIPVSCAGGACGIALSLFCNGDGTWTLTSGSFVYTATASSINPLFLSFPSVWNECGANVAIAITN